MKKIILSKQDKILLTILELANETKKNLKFEDIVVAIYKNFPEEFHLKGYKEYPDADLIRRPLYTFRNHGILLVRNMIFSLTDKGLDEALKIKNQASGKSIEVGEMFDRYVEKELRRIKGLNGLMLFVQGKGDSVLDIDFFDYLGISVKSDRIEFNSRLKILSDLADILRKQSGEEFVMIKNFHDFMVDKFNEIINYKLKN